MPKIKPRPNGPQWSVANVPTEVPDWEAARVFLEVSRCGSFRAAAQKLGHSVNALRRTVEKFEQDLGVQLLTRYVRGVQLTEEGSRIAEAARQMESASFNLLLARNSSDTQATGEVRLSVTEGLGTYWLLPHLIRFQRANPGVVINMRCGQQPADLLRLEADLSVQLQRPIEPDLKVVKLGRLHMLLWASRGYIAEYGRPESLADLKKHRLIILASEDRIQWERDYQKSLGDMAAAGSVLLRTNSSNAQFWAMVGGAGIGFLPTYQAALGSDLIPLDLVEPPHYDIWLAYHPNAKRISRIRKMMDWIVKSYDPRQMPWFRDEFVHPDKFAQITKTRPPAGMIAVPPEGLFF